MVGQDGEPGAEAVGGMTTKVICKSESTPGYSQVLWFFRKWVLNRLQFFLSVV
jgi:hypothetical protein